MGECYDLKTVGSEMANMCLEATWYFTSPNIGASYSKEIPWWEVLRQRQNTMFSPFFLPTTRRFFCFYPSLTKMVWKITCFLRLFFANHKILATKKPKRKNLPELLESCRTAVTAHNLNPRHTLEQKQSQPTGAKTPGPCWPKTSCSILSCYSVFERFYRFRLIAIIPVYAVMS